MKNIAVILAGGTGRRMGAEVPKQFLPLKGKSVLEHSVDTFLHHPAIGGVAVVCHPDWRAEAKRLLAGRAVTLIDGGNERYLSSLNAIVACMDMPDDTNLLLHDAARPLVSIDIIDRVVNALADHEAVGVAVPSADTVWEVRSTIEHDALARNVARIPERRTMWLAQTPQAFRLPVIRDAYQRALQDPHFASTDDCGVVRKYMPEVHIHVVEGNAANRKITTPEDLKLLQLWML